ncbi:MAG: thioesterase [Spirochaetes bacterium]|nr:thioesterase [Spirochaetota bacterium]
MSNFLERVYNLRYFEMDAHGLASPTTIFTLLEETAAEHCLDIGYGLYRLEKQNIGWVLISGKVAMLRYPKYKENITIRTWLSKYSLVKGHRENIIFDEAGKIIGKAKGTWVFYDIKNRKPAPIFNDIKENWGFRQEISVEENLELVNEAESGSFKMEFDIYRSDVDTNNHVNNIRFFHFLMESLPKEIADHYFLREINAKFFAEAKFGEKIQVYTNDDLESHKFLHTMKSSVDQKVFAKAHTQWEKI